MDVTPGTHNLYQTIEITFMNTFLHNIMNSCVYGVRNATDAGL